MDYKITRSLQVQSRSSMLNWVIANCDRLIQIIAGSRRIAAAGRNDWLSYLDQQTKTFSPNGSKKVGHSRLLVRNLCPNICRYSLQNSHAQIETRIDPGVNVNFIPAKIRYHLPIPNVINIGDSSQSPVQILWRSGKCLRNRSWNLCRTLI